MVKRLETEVGGVFGNEKTVKFKVAIDLADSREIKKIVGEFDGGLGSSVAKESQVVGTNGSRNSDRGWTAGNKEHVTICGLGIFS